MGGKSKAPPPPDYKGAAEASAEASKENIALQNFANRPDQYNPWAAQTWDSWTEYDPASGQQFVDGHQSGLLQQGHVRHRQQSGWPLPGTGRLDQNFRPDTRRIAHSEG